MSHPNRLDLVRASLVMTAVVLSAAQISTASAVFDFEFDSFAVSGSVDFDDDFEDGLRDVAPTSALVDRNDGTVTIEAEGALIFSDSDGSALEIDGTTVLRTDTVVLESMPIINSGTGTTTVSGALSSSAGFVLPTPPQTSRFAGVEFGSTTDSDATSVGVMVAGDSVSIVWMEVVAGIDTILGSDTLDRGDLSTSDAIILQISLDQTLDLAMVRYSLDGGSSFIEQTNWDSPPELGGFDFDQDLFAQLSASAQTVPEASSPLLGAAGLVALGLLRKIRNVSERSTHPA